jgi:hypothetical protein
MFCLGWDKDFPVSPVAHALQCIQIWALATAVRTTESTRNLSVLRIQNAMSQQRSLDVKSKVRFSILSAAVFRNRYFFVEDKGLEVYVHAFLTLALNEVE